ncbi:metallophosphoesterase [Hyalangium minutum]|uniref:Ser/Thr protein phosphatase family protein n=1 Tax=Hyalangium minutum TaxID=394096 RepID=A0A085WAV3_9BACT|nr:Ser/Thr protein phosphatase family protein [Hyalangium minutum]
MSVMMISRLLILALLNLIGYAVVKRLWPAFSRGWRAWTYAGLVALSFLAWGLPLVLGLGLRGQIPVIGVPLKLFSTMWMVAVLIVVLFGTPFVLVRWWKLRRATASAAGPVAGGVDLERRGVLMNMGRAVPVVAVGTSSAGVVLGSSGFVVRKLEVRLKDLPDALDGFRIGQITDIHVGPFITTQDLRAAVEAMNAAEVHLQVMTGDLIDDVEQVDGTMEALAACKAPHGMLAILGNHEYWRGVEPILEGYESLAKRAPVRLLVDESHVIEHGGERLRVVGVDYPMARRNPFLRAEQMRSSAEKAFGGTSPGEVVLCLTHHPSFFPLAAERGAHLTLAGHTHGGQVAFFGFPLFWFVFDYMLGRYKLKDRHLYVSGGTGHWLPFRIGIPPEVSILTLRKA